MNIAHVLPYSASFPLKKHNGRYEWALRLAKLQADAGHDVTLYCGPSELAYSGLKFETISTAFGNRHETNLALFQLAFRNPAHHIFHSHFDTLHYDAASATKQPVVVTQHWFPTEKIADAARQSTAQNIYVVPVTNHMKAADEALGVDCRDVIYHGIDLSLFSPHDKPERERLLFVGRIAPHKGVRELVMAVLNTEESLDIIGKLNTKDQAYWKEILPYVDSEKIRYLGPKDQEEVASYMAEAKAFVFFPQQAEAFGQTIVEAQACDTPVIVNDLGANAELVIEGSSGFVLNGQTLSETISRLAGIKSGDCRAAASRFDIKDMVFNYERLYKSLLSQN